MSNQVYELNRLNAREISLSYFDACPSELFLSSNSEYITHAGIHYFMIKKHELKKIPQFKKSRGLGNKLKWINYLTENIENEKIRFYCRAINTNRTIGFRNGLSFLLKEGIINSKHNLNLNEKIKYQKNEISIKNLIALSWYAISLILISQKLAFITKIENKKQFVFLLDLLPTDSILSTRYFELFKSLVFDSHLFKYLNEDLLENKLEKFGIAYGLDNGSTKKIKNWHEYVITDWIVSSVNYSINNFNSENDKIIEFVKYLKLKKILDTLDCPLIKL